MPAVLRAELQRASAPREQVALGTATDCYQPLEARYRLTRHLLEALCERPGPLGVVTKAPLLLRDLDLWQALAQRADVRVYFTITTLDGGLWRQLEPGTPHPRKRLAAVERLNAAGVRAGVLMAPIVPGLTDAPASIEAVAAAAAAHGAASFGAGALRLAPGVREHFLDYLAASFPALVERYERAYRGVNAPRAYLALLDERIAAARARFGFDRGRLPPRLAAGAMTPAVPRHQAARAQLPLPW